MFKRVQVQLNIKLYKIKILIPTRFLICYDTIFDLFLSRAESIKMST